MPKLVNPLSRRKSTPSPFSTLRRKKPGVRKAAAEEKEAATDRLSDTGLVPSLAPPGIAQDVVSLIRHAQVQMWDDIPEPSGMGSERISEVLRFRRGLPKVVSLAHLHALSTSSTDTERELAGLVARGVVRKVRIPGRGKGGSAVGEGVVLVTDWVERVTGDENVEQEVKEKYVTLLREHSTSATTPTSTFSQPEIQTLVSAGFLTSPSALATSTSLFASPRTASSLLTSAGSSNPTGSLAAVGGYGALHDAGGTINSHQTPRPAYTRLTQEMTFSIPNTGAYLSHLTASRSHLITLLKNVSPRHRECTIDLLKEKWEGNVLGDAASRAKRARGEWNGVLAGKTRKWREFCGVRFEWVLAECVGSGMVEVFETGVGVRGVRGR
jgi:hypothetical protein